jgi:GNAT superfamily N-acetyltransferase
MGMKSRDVTPLDIEAIAELHADSWRRHYRGSYSDAFLDGDVFADRLAVWTDRLQQPDPGAITIVVEHDGEVVAFAHTILDDDPKWGALLDNLHVVHNLQASGVGTRLMAETAAAVLERTPSSGLYLWVLERNTAAQAFYTARGGAYVDQKEGTAPGGGEFVALRVVWPDPSTLLESN